jgi:Zeta toxin
VTNTLTKQLSTAIYKSRIVPSLFDGVNASRNPLLQVILGAPGSGASVIRVALMKSHADRNGAVVLVSKMLEHFHPTAWSVNAGASAGDAAEWLKRGLKDARRARMNVILDGMPSDVRSLLRHVDGFRKDEYAVEVHVMAVPLEDSWRGIRHRIEFGCQLSSAENHDVVEREFKALPSCVKRLEHVADRLVIYRRTSEVIYENRRVDDELQFAEVGDRAVTQETDRDRTADELQARVVEMSSIHEMVVGRPNSTQVEQREAEEKLKQSREEFRRALEPRKTPSKAASIEASFRDGETIARRFGGADASLIEPIPGRRSKGPILGETREHVIQGTKTSKGMVYVAHLKRDLGRVPKVGETVTIQYTLGRAGVKSAKDTQTVEETTFIENSRGSKP